MSLFSSEILEEKRYAEQQLAIKSKENWDDPPLLNSSDKFSGVIVTHLNKTGITGKLFFSLFQSLSSLLTDSQIVK